MKNCLVLDDEQHCVDMLTDYISSTPNLTLVGAFRNPLEAIAIIQSQKIDIAFIDVQMPNLTGLQYLKLLDKNTKVVLCTAYAEYAVDAYELDVVDYLLKPITFERFLRALKKTEDPLKTGPLLPETENEYIFVKADAKLKFTKINLKDILYIEGYGNYQKIQTTDGQIIAQLKLKDLEEQLASSGFMRVHKSFIVSLDKIDHFESGKLLIGKFEIPVSDRFNEQLFAKLSTKMLG